MATTRGGLAAARTSDLESAQRAQAATDQRKRMVQLIKSMAPAIKAALPAVMTPERFTRIVTTAINNNQGLMQCNPTSLLGAMMQAAQLGVEPNTPLGQAYLLPYWNRHKGCYDAQFQLGYKGMIDLAYRSGSVKDIQAHEVHENDEFSYEYGLDPKLVHKPAMHDRGQVYAYYAVWHAKDGGYGFQVASVEDILEHKKRFSKAGDSGPWKTDFDAMAKKTVIKMALKYAPMKSDFVRAIAADESVKNYDPSTAAKDATDVLDAPNEMQYADPVDSEGKMEDPAHQLVPPNIDPETGEIIKESEE